MVLDAIFERFAEQSPVTVMARAALEHALSPRAIDALFEEVAERQYTRTLLFSTVVDLMSTVVCKVRPALHAAFQANAESIGVSLRAVYDKIDRLEPGVSAGLVRHTARTLGPVITAMGGERVAWLPGYPVKILDGNHLAGTEHRLKELRTVGAGALPGHALVVLDPQAMLVTDVFPCEDGHAQERSLLDRVLETIRSGEVWIADRNFCTTGFLFGIARRGGHFVIRQHQSTLHIELIGQRRASGRAETGSVFEQEVRLSDEDGEALKGRRITVALDKPTRDGEDEIHILTDLAAGVADAVTIAELYRKRWTVESAFGELATCLDGEVNTLGYPKAALFAFCVALVAYNVLGVVKAALRSVHGAGAVEVVSGYYLADEIAGTHRGMMIAIPEDEWTVFADLSASALGGMPKGLAAKVRLSTLRKHPRGPKRLQPKRESGAKIKHVSTARLLRSRKMRT
ncbi:MAG: transposase family protein [Planctomycetota bacterium]|nr:transposase family protein [Planctomycetota bacterium]